MRPSGIAALPARLALAAALLVAAASLDAGADPPSDNHAGAAAVDALAAFADGSSQRAVQLSATLGLDGAYDSNVYNGRGPDYVTRLSPRLAFALLDRRYTFTAAYELGLWAYLDGKAKDSVNHRALLAVDARLTRRLALHIADELVRAEDPGFLIRAGVVAPQTGITDNIADALLAYRLARRLDGQLGYSFRITRFDRQALLLAPLHDGDEHDAAAALALRWTRADDLRIGYRFQYFLADGNGLAYTNSPVAGWRHRILRDLELRAEGGPLRYSTLAFGGASGWTGRGSALLRYYTPTWRAALSYTHDLVGGTGAASVLWGDALYGQVGYRLGNHLDFHGGVGFFANGLAPSGARLYDGVTVDAVADARLIANLRVAVYYNFRWQEAALAAAGGPFDPVTRHIVGVRLFAVVGAETRPAHLEVHP